MGRGSEKEQEINENPDLSEAYLVFLRISNFFSIYVRKGLLRAN
jgi:hypothetical protein